MDAHLSGEGRLGQARLPKLPHQNLDLRRSPPPPSRVTPCRCHPARLPRQAAARIPWGSAYAYGAGAGRPPHSTTRRHPVPTKPSLQTETPNTKPEERATRTESPDPEPGTRPGTTSTHRPQPLTRATPLHSVALRASKTISKHNLADTSLPVDNPHRRCSAWLGRVVMQSLL